MSCYRKIPPPCISGGGNAENTLLGKRVKAVLGREDVTVTVLNDTVDTLMPGQAHAYNRPFSNYYGFILGIGMNCVYIETGKHIGKLDLPSDKSMIINSESGAYGRIASGAGGC